MLTENHIENDPGLRTDEDFIYNIRAFVHAKKQSLSTNPCMNILIVRILSPMLISKKTSVSILIIELEE